jgi:hypothetical protein
VVQLKLADGSAATVTVLVFEAVRPPVWVTVSVTA